MFYLFVIKPHLIIISGSNVSSKKLNVNASSFYPHPPYSLGPSLLVTIKFVSYELIYCSQQALLYPKIHQLVLIHVGTDNFRLATRYRWWSASASAESKKKLVIMKNFALHFACVWLERFRGVVSLGFLLLGAAAVPYSVFFTSSQSLIDNRTMNIEYASCRGNSSSSCSKKARFVVERK